MINSMLSTLVHSFEAAVAQMLCCHALPWFAFLIVSHQLVLATNAITCCNCCATIHMCVSSVVGHFDVNT